jgi:hypothetical protein
MAGKCSSDDDEIAALSDELYALANVLVEAFVPRARLTDSALPQDQYENATFNEITAMLKEEDRYLVEQRATMMEVDGGCDRKTAETFALRDYWNCQLKGGGSGQ